MTISFRKVQKEGKLVYPDFNLKRVNQIDEDAKISTFDIDTFGIGGFFDKPVFVDENTVAIGMNNLVYRQWVVKTRMKRRTYTTIVSVGAKLSADGSVEFYAGTSTCDPRDTYNFNMGAAIANTRLRTAYETGDIQMKFNLRSNKNPQDPFRFVGYDTIISIIETDISTPRMLAEYIQQASERNPLDIEFVSN